MSQILTVTNAFSDYRRGDQITEPKAVKEILASDFASNVVKVEAPDAPAPSAPAHLED
jgi:hypothetical protein